MTWLDDRHLPRGVLRARAMIIACCAKMKNMRKGAEVSASHLEAYRWQIQDYDRLLGGGKPTFGPFMATAGLGFAGFLFPLL